MNPVRALREQVGLTQEALAERAGTSQPTIAAYEAGTKSPTVRTLQRMASAVGLEAVVSYVPPLTREDRRSLMLHRHIARRLRSDPAHAKRVARENVQLMWERQPGARQLLREWRAILRRPIDDVVSVLADPSPHARDLRQVTPFAGVLTAVERAEAYQSFRKSEAA